MTKRSLIRKSCQSVQIQEGGQDLTFDFDLVSQAAYRLAGVMAVRNDLGNGFTVLGDSCINPD